MNYNQIAAFVRAQADSDTVDAPDTTLSVYAAAAFNDIRRRVSQWPDKLVDYTFTSVNGQAKYKWADIAPTTLEFVVSLAGPTDVVQWVSPESYLLLITGAAASGSQATYYTTDDFGVTLFPTPKSAKLYKLVGYRTFTDWALAATEPDLPREFDHAICWYMLARFYQAQEDLELARTYMEDYERTVNKMIAATTRTSAATAGPIIFGGPYKPKLDYTAWMKRNLQQ